ncbi:polysaccharide deacetylase [Bailinhaonella thermotolerans]|uniref:Polysaccharide deacetylase n=2 Tax=Bailinhaonella thermotolerans TaxID=1070861 RepID=A0A3A4ADU3_9ACTN|nr:polysaccharide deacetylase [Bailinhaonella thermotolerans]
MVVAFAVLVAQLPARRGEAVSAPPRPAPGKAVPGGTPVPAPRPAPPDPASVKANELGMMPILMYHRILAKRQAELDRTPEQLRRELVRLAREGYVPVTAAEFAAGRMDIPAGRHPVALTFDDGHPSHFRFGPDGQPAPGTAARVILDVAREYPGFRPVATFWVNREPFGLTDPAEQARAVQWLTRHGFEVANHTWSHPALNTLPRKKVVEQIDRTQRMIEDLGGGKPTTLALPYGIMPKRREWARRDFAGVFLAGASPSVSPFHRDYSPLGIQRIQSNGKKGDCRLYCSQAWLDWLRAHPEKRYTSDGNPEKISFPRGLLRYLDRERKNLANPYDMPGRSPTMGQSPGAPSTSPGVSGSPSD